MLSETNKNSVTLRKSAKLPKLNIQEHIDNQEIVERMNRKIAFTKNPRHLHTTLQYSNALETGSNQQKFRVEPDFLLFTNY